MAASMAAMDLARPTSKWTILLGKTTSPRRAIAGSTLTLRVILTFTFSDIAYSPMTCRTGALYASFGGKRIWALRRAVSAYSVFWGEHSPSRVVIIGFGSSTRMSMADVRKYVKYGRNFSVTVPSGVRCSPFCSRPKGRAASGAAPALAAPRPAGRRPGWRWGRHSSRRRTCGRCR